MTKSRLASELQVDRKRVSKMLATVPPGGKVDRYDGWYLSTACPFIYGLDQLDEELNRDPETMGPKDRKDWYDGTDTKVKLEEKAGLVIPAEEVRRGVATPLEVLDTLLEMDYVRVAIMDAWMNLYFKSGIKALKVKNS